MNRPEDKNQNAFKSAVTITVIGVAAITFIVIFLALFAGRWIDGLLSTKPIFTIGLVIISIPVTIVLMLRLVKVATSRLKPDQSKPSAEEQNRGTND
jgi:ABC-type transport system involved in cytochrome c biogenesis permease subunit